MSDVPTEDEIRAIAKELGYTDEHGNYPKNRRNELAIAAAEYKAGQQEQREREISAPLDGSTVEQLARFEAELRAAGYAPDRARHLSDSIAPALVRRQGIHFSHEGTAQ
ncbi:UNVERIFIED_ORG: chorismate mutase [Rhodococcus erythropolis]